MGTKASLPSLSKESHVSQLPSGIFHPAGSRGPMFRAGGSQGRHCAVKLGSSELAMQGLGSLSTGNRCFFCGTYRWARVAGYLCPSYFLNYMSKAPGLSSFCFQQCQKIMMLVLCFGDALQDLVRMNGVTGCQGPNVCSRDSHSTNRCVPSGREHRGHFSAL